MKVLIATPYFYPRTGGLENYARNIAAGLQTGGREVVVVCGDKGVTSVTREVLDGYTVYRLPIWKIASNTPINLGWLRMLRRIIRDEQPNVINAHTPVPFMVDMVTWAAGRIPVVVTYHAATLVKPGGLLMRTVTSVYQMVQAVTLTRARAIIAVSPYVREALSPRLRAKTHIVFNAVSGVAAKRSDPGTGLVFVANLEPTHAWKGLDVTLESLAILARTTGAAPALIVIGDGADRSRYERRVRELGLEAAVTFAGRKVGAERDQLVRKAAAMVIYPTTANDAFPTVLLEAWAQGLPVIASAIGPLPSLVEPGKTGVLAAPDDAAALAGAIRELLTDPAAAQAMGEAGRQLVAAEYTWPRQIERTKTLLENLI